MVMLAIIIGLIAVTAITIRLSPISSAKARGFEIATTTALYLDSLLLSEEGSVIMDAGSHKYDIEVCYVDSTWTVIKEKVLSLFMNTYEKEKGFYVVVVPYDDSGERIEDDWSAFIIKSYGKGSGCKAKLKEVSKFCINKDADSKLAEVKTC